MTLLQQYAPEAAWSDTDTMRPADTRIARDTLVTWRITHPAVKKVWCDVGATFEPIAERFTQWLSANVLPTPDPFDGLTAEWYPPHFPSGLDAAWLPWDAHPTYRDAL